MNRKKTKARESDEYMQKLKEWQDKQFVPGYYTGGRIHPLLSHPGKPQLLGVLLLILGLPMPVIEVISLVRGDADLLEAAIPVIFSLIICAAGIRLLFKKHR